MATLTKLDSGSYELAVNGVPRILRAAELNNSSLSSFEYMEEVWPKLRDANVDTALGGVGWDTIEPEEGKFEFAELDKVINAAREHGISLILLWFGSFKNGASSYTPRWVKLDQRRFPLAHIKSASGIAPSDTLSPCSSASREADAKAFGKLMEHIKEVDEETKTVICVQVENETGLLGDSRDRSALAQGAFDADVPKEFLAKMSDKDANLNSHMLALIDNCSGTGSWVEVFGKGSKTDEAFMAYQYARYIETVAAAGKKAYPDMLYYTNAWLINPDEETKIDNVPVGGANPGQYPSGGPVETVLDIWRHFAPSLSFFSPDIYCKAYTFICDQFTHQQALFIPEQPGDVMGCANIWVALGRHGGIGCSPFGIDYASDQQSPLGDHYALLKKVSPLILSARREGRRVDSFAFAACENGSPEAGIDYTILFDKWHIRIQRAMSFADHKTTYGMVIEQSNDVFYFIGEGYRAAFISSDPTVCASKVLSCEEIDVNDEGHIRTVRQFNGDDTMSGAFVSMPSAQVGYGEMNIWVLVPSRTKIVRATPFAIHR